MPASISQQVPFTLPPGAQTTLWGKVSTGGQTTYAITQNNYLFSWGVNANGNLADGTTVNKSSPVQVGVTYNETTLAVYANSMGIPLNSWVQVASGVSSMAAIRSDGALFTWGVGSQGELANSQTTLPVSYPTRIGTSSWSSISAGVTHFAAIRSDGMLFAWGSNLSGQLGDGTLVNKSSPVQIGTNSYINVNAGPSNTSAIDSAYSLWTWGNNAIGQLGTNDLISRSAPVQIGLSAASGYYSTSFNGTSTYLQAGAIALGNDFTVEAWVYPVATNTGLTIFDNRGTVSTTTGMLFDLEVSGSNFLTFRTNGNTPYRSSYSVPLNQWTHVACVRNSGVVTLYANGVSVLTLSYATNLTDTLSRIGSPVDLNTAYNFNGFISNLRVVSGVAVYTTDFTPPTSPLTAIANTQLLVLQDSTFIDNSSNNFGLTQVGAPTSTLYNQPFDSTGITNVGPSWTQVSTGSSIVAAITSTGNVFTWGAAAAGQVGQGILVHRSSPVQISTFAGNEAQIDSYVSATGYGGTVYNSWVKVASAATYNFSIRDDGLLFGWGDNTLAQLGINNLVSQSAPTPIGSSSWTQIFTGDNTSFAIRSDGGLFVWGNNTSGALGTNDLVHRSSPVQLGTDSWISVAAGGIYPVLNTIAVRSDGMLFAWGTNSVGQLGLNDRVHRSSPVQVGTSSWSQVASGASTTIAVRADGGLFTWGQNTNGELSSNNRIHRSSPVQVGTSSWSQIAAGFNHVLAITASGALFTWGLGSTGQLGSNAALSRSSPVQVGSSSWSSIGSGTFWSFGILTNNILYGWGSNVAGNLGLGDLLNKSSPVQIGSSSWTIISTSNTNSAPMAVRSDGRLFQWGSQYSGDGVLRPLGNYRFNITNSPIVITSFTESYFDVSAGTSHMAAIRNDGILWTWGLGTSGQLGDGTILSRSAPIQIGSSYWNNVTTGGTHTVALNANNNLFTWGLGTSGQLGDGTLISKSSPVQIGSAVYDEVKASLTSTYAKKENYSLYGWGLNNNQFGSLGLRGNQSRPTLIGVMPDSWTLATGTQAGNYGFGIRADGLLFAWGQNTSGQLGDGTLLAKSNPVQLGSGAPVGYYSNLFNGTTDSLSLVNNAAFNLGTNDFTVECWFRLTGDSGLDGSNTRTAGLFGPGQLTTGACWVLVVGGNSTITGTYLTFQSRDATGTATNLTYTISITKNTWYHVAVSKVGTTIAMFVNGEKVVENTSWTVASNSGGSLFRIGKRGVSTTYEQYFPGYISNVRVINGSGIYTDNFTPSTSPLTAIANTVLLTSQGIGFSDNSNNNFGVTLIGSPTLSTVYPSSFVAPPGGTGNKSWLSVTGGTLFSGALTNTRELYTWGDDAAGQLGIEAGLAPTSTWLIPRSSPVQVGTVAFAASPVQVGNSSWTQISAGTNFVLAARADGTLFGWGLNNAYQLGDNTQIHRSSPVQISTSSWSMISAGDVHSLAIAGDKTLYGWGTTGYPNYTYLLPTTSDNEQFTQVSEGLSSVFGVKADGTLWAWGDNTDGELGLGDRVHRSSPTQVGTESWLQVFSGGFSVNSTYALRSDGKMFAWGYNAGGVLGLNDRVHRSSPTQVGSDTWRYISASGIAIKNDYTLWAWGDDASLNTTGALRSSPVQVGTSSWITVSANQGVAHALRLDRSLFAWGSNGYGQLGTNEPFGNTKSSPTQVGTSFWNRIASGNQAVFAIDITGKLFAWGTNSAGNLGLGNTVHRSSPVQVGTSSWASIASSNSFPAASLTYAFTIAVRADGALFAWGGNNGRLGTNDALGRSSPVQVGTSSWSLVSAGSSSAIAIRSDGVLFAWGGGLLGEVGDNTNISRSSPVQITATPQAFKSQPVQISASSWSQVSAGYSHSLAIRADNTLWGWGGPAANEFVTYSWTQVSGGTNFGIALRNDGALFAWGSNSFGQLGQGDVINRSSPVQIGTSSWSVVSAGVGATAAIRIDGSLFIWGSGGNGQLGLGDVLNRSSPVQVGTSSWITVNTTIGNTTYAIRNDNSLFAWGNSSASFPLGDGATVSRSSPVQIGTSSWTQVGGALAIAAIRSDGGLFMWGGGGGGVLGYSSANASVAPVAVSSLNTEDDVLSYVASNSLPLYSWSQISSGLSHTVLLRSDYKLFVFGSSASGQLGDNSTINKFFVQQLGNDSWISVAAGGFASAAIRSDGLLFTWGDNSSGALGSNTIVHRSSPVQVGTSIWTNVYMGSSSGTTIAMYAIRASDRALFAWGLNGNGNLGLNDSVNRSSPVQIGTSSWAMVAGTATTSIGIRIDGSMFAWGLNTNGTIGDNSRINKSSPVQIGTSSWTKVATSTLSSAAIKVDGTLYTWGLNNAGQLGQGDTINRSSPVQVGGGSWATVSVAPSFMAAIDSDNQLFAWGYNNNGQLGQQDLIHRSSPTQIGTSSWTTVSLGETNLIASRSDNLIFGVGVNNNGQLGTIKISPTSYSSPVVVMTVTDSWTQVSVGGTAAAEQFALGIRNDKMLFAWGDNGKGQLGLDNTQSRSAPVQMGAQSWNLIRAQASHAIALDTNNKLYVWGGNTNGQLGVNDTVHRSSPVQMGTYSWNGLLSGTTSSTAAVNTDGVLFVWGGNTTGSIGLSDTVHRSSPVQLGSIEGYVRNPQDYPVITQIGNSSWNNISAGDNYSMATRTDDALFVWGFSSGAPLKGSLTNIGYSAAQISSGTSHFGFVKKT